MSPRPDVFEYDSISDLEDTIEHVYEKVDRLDEETDTLVDQLQSFLNYEHDPETLQESMEYVEENLQQESWAGLVNKYAREELENPEQADNWDDLVELAESADDISERFIEAYESLWAEFGITGDTRDERIRDRPPVSEFFRAWKNDPHTLFPAEDSYSDGEDQEAGRGSRPTMARYVEDADDRSLTSKQMDDLMRGKDINRHERDRDDHGVVIEEDDFQFWRNRLSQSDPENPFSSARWVNTELMLLENTLKGTPIAFEDEEKKQKASK